MSGYWVSIHRDTFCAGCLVTVQHDDPEGMFAADGKLYCAESCHEVRADSDNQSQSDSGRRTVRFSGEFQLDAADIARIRSARDIGEEYEKIREIFESDNDIWSAVLDAVIVATRRR